MKTIQFLTLVCLFLVMSSCNKDDDNTSPPPEIEFETVANLHAPQEGGQGEPVSGAFTKFDFATGTTTTSATDWDIAFRGTEIIVNGGVSSGTTDEPERTGNAAVYIVNGSTLANVKAVETALFVQDSETGYAIAAGSENGWYTYEGPPTHLIRPIPGKILVFRTRNNTYAKVEILSYYKDAPENPDAFVDEDRYYTFNYVYQSEEGVTTF